MKSWTGTGAALWRRSGPSTAGRWSTRAGACRMPHPRPRPTTLHSHWIEGKTIDLSGHDFECSGPAECIDMQRKASGDVPSGFQPYSCKKKLELVRRIYHRMNFLSNLPESVVKDFAANRTAAGNGDSVRPTSTAKRNGWNRSLTGATTSRDRPDEPGHQPRICKSRGS